ncbi:methylene-tetrahydromethanopterin reductase [Nitratireductor aestuarii]|uniref:Methylene-tetrahydromethanopterin reductase n=1 Tax=Nitratireductor aestuarii TaxID=1735103 RepID=A0A916RXP7_9HYPH|nr:NtaA/DmoA family FMN-dependent monooxygenase [Nitratireductor aestuarii]GGA75479.1 methylene-tetrahydromethanopterin reductase [Nitratireductor aestuarii]
MTAKMHLGYDLSWIQLEGRWRLPGSWTNATYPDIRIFKELALIAERGLLDFMFWGDGTGIPSTWKGNRDAAVHWGVGWPRQDMSPYIAALSQITSRIGFGLTYSSTYMHPFYTARLLNSLDHVTNGRMAFNIVTSSRKADAQNYGFDELMAHEQRYERMEEFVHVCKSLWASVEPDAFIWDRETGQMADPSKVKAIEHRGKFFNVMGPLPCVPSPQGRPVLVQAGASPRGIRASANFADMVFAASPGLEKQVRHRQALDAALTAEGRDPLSVGIVWDVVLIVGETEEDAKRRHQQLLSAVPLEAVGAFMSHGLGYDLSTLPDRFTVEEINAEIVKRNASPVAFLNTTAGIDPKETITKKDFYEIIRHHTAGYDHAIVGTAAQVADYLEEVFVATGERGGFMIAHPPAVPRDLLNIVDFLVPELQRRGRFRKEYRYQTLRENLLES